MIQQKIVFNIYIFAYLHCAFVVVVLLCCKNVCIMDHNHIIIFLCWAQTNWCWTTCI